MGSGHRYPNVPRWKTTAELIGIVAIIVYSVLTYFLWDTAHRQLVSSERPWLKATVALEQPPHIHGAGPGLTFLKDGSASFSFFVTVKNVGHSPAKDIYMSYEMYPPPFTKEGLDEPNRRQRDFCARSQTIPQKEDMLDSLLPDDSTTYDSTISMDKKDIDKALALLSKDMGKYCNDIASGLWVRELSPLLLQRNPSKPIYVRSWPCPSHSGTQRPAFRLQVLEWPDGGKRYD
jgi:hypothetical protein